MAIQPIQCPMAHLLVIVCQLPSQNSGTKRKISETIVCELVDFLNSFTHLFSKDRF